MNSPSKIILGLAIVSLFAVWSGSDGFGQEIKIGVAGPMAFIQGQHHWAGAELAAGEINAKGGVFVDNKRVPIKLVKIDTNEMVSISNATSALERAILKDKINFFAGGFRSEAVLAMQDIAMDYRKIFLGCGASLPELCNRVEKNYDRYKYWFRIAPLNSLFLAKVDFLLVEMVAKALVRELGITNPKVAIIAEKLAWGDLIVGAARKNLPKMGMEIVGEWRPSATATDVTAELSAIRTSGAHMIFTTFSGPVGIAYSKKWGELKIPAASIGINVEAQKKGFWKATAGMGNYETTLNTFGRAELTAATIPFIDKFTQKVREFPTYNASTYDAIQILASTIEKTGTLDPQKLIGEIETTNHIGAAGRIAFTKDHDITWGPGYVTNTGTQWRDGNLNCVWPVDWEGINYKGTVKYQLPPWVVERWKRK